MVFTVLGPEFTPLIIISKMPVKIVYYKLGLSFKLFSIKAEINFEILFAS